MAAPCRAWLIPSDVNWAVGGSGRRAAAAAVTLSQWTASPPAKSESKNSQRPAERQYEAADAIVAKNEGLAEDAGLRAITF